MKNLTKCKLAFVVAAAMGIAGCGSDGKDGQDGAPGEPGPGPNPPVVETSEVTNVEFISHMVEEGQVTLEFEITDEDGALINGLENAAVYLAAMTEMGIQRARDGSVGGSATAGGDEPTEGATLTMLDDGRYEFVAPMSAVQADTEGLIRLQVGGGDIATSPYIIVNKPEMTHTTTTETCYSCHVDYATSDIKHSKYVALNTDGEVDFVGGCMVCHNNVAKNEDGQTGGYASNTMQKLGHINHQKFEKDFTPVNCYTCHVEPVMNKEWDGNGCSDCHTDTMNSLAKVSSNKVSALSSSSSDIREVHAQKVAGITERKTMRKNYYTETSAVYQDDEHGYCVDVKLFDNSGDSAVQLNIGEMYEAHTVTYAGAYVNAYDNETDSIVARVIGHGAESYVERPDGTRSVCYPELLNGPGTGYEDAHLTTSSRVTLADSNWEDDDGKFGVSFTGFSEVVDNTFTAIDKEFSRRHNVDADSCTTCHNNETNYHKNGSYNTGGESCIACHNNGQDRAGARTVAMDAFATDEKRIEAGYTIPAMDRSTPPVQTGWKAPSGAGFGPLIHAWHWGMSQPITGSEMVEQRDGTFEEELTTNSAINLNGDNCVSCHSNGIDLSLVPNRYMKSKASSDDGVAGVVSSPISANCLSCHYEESDISHMESNGGDLNITTPSTEWHTIPTAESCATCHDTGKSFGIDKYHNFER
ncbi:hypothetical protein L2735_08695 [Shewanella olleyana]|uniref:multiheme c-type cytochrome n=1 Tax=Shewanella olleyana TaxID=135626 RepID=UPI00200E8CFC|nr:hypothetical protein [Shewanella olleyana]MCL1066882.1 hypothetical protein [Shewanella olleyana]